ncbi:putative membrane protein [Campylobacter pinnipediorum subsp. caledonicus]|uniref:Putative membrane protein n=2 Tax=Campylobacter TaxID=194 RepID=A0A1S6U6D1_9BACT|nr:putative membrane protein [Campylobacter pinnipediorum subsp. caledonicus]
MVSTYSKSSFYRMKWLDFKGVLFALLFLVSACFGDKFVFNDDNILSQKVEEKLQTIADELYSKTGIFVGASVFENLNKQSLDDKFLSLNIKEPFAFIALAKDEKKVEIYADKKTLELFNKDQILSPFPESGTILPILASKNGKDIYNAAILNGYGDLSEQIAKSKNIKLVNAIGNSNKDTLNLLRFFIYGSMIFVFCFMFYKKRVAKNV